MRAQLALLAGLAGLRKARKMVRFVIRTFGVVMTLLAIQWLVSVKVVLSLIETFILTECINTASFFFLPSVQLLVAGRRVTPLK